jgi:hypothetical protein
MRPLPASADSIAAFANKRKLIILTDGTQLQLMVNTVHTPSISKTLRMLLSYRKGGLKAIRAARAGLLVVALVVSPASAAQAALSESSPGSPVEDEEPANASAITTGMYSAIASLASRQANAPAEGRELSDIQIAFGNTPTPFIVTSSPVTFIDINSAGMFTINPGPIGDWAAAMSINQFFWAAAETGSTGGRPIELIIEPFDNGINYSDPDRVIIANHPQAQDTGTFDWISNGLAPTFISRSRTP